MMYTITVVNPDGTNPRTLSIDLTQAWSGYVLPSSVVPNPEQPRTYFDEDKLASDGESISKRQEDPVTIVPHMEQGRPEVRWMIGDGERRWRITHQEAKSSFWVCYSPVITKDNLFEHAFKANFCRQGHTHRDTANAIDRLIRAGKKYWQIGDMVGKSKAWAENEHALLKLHPDLLKLMDPPVPSEKRLSTAVALLLVKYSQAEQIAMWSKHSGTPKKQLYHILRLAQPKAEKGKRGRKPSDDRRYVGGKIASMAKDIRAVEELPETLFDCFAGEDVDEVLTYLRIIGEQAQALATRIKFASTRPKTEVSPADTEGGEKIIRLPDQSSAVQEDCAS